jgi:hypothetical protein
MAISGTGNKGWKPLNKGLWESLLCRDCEAYINSEFEQPFQKQWVAPFSLPEFMDRESVHSAIFDYKIFKLFHLSILFRCSVSSLPTFREVRLGKHEEKIRQMLLAKDAGLQSEYPILAFAVLNAKSEVEKRLITQPIVARYDGHVVYGQIYAGAMWWISVTSHRNEIFCSAGLQSSGRMTFVAEPMSEIGIIQDASVLLNRVRYN